MRRAACIGIAILAVSSPLHANQSCNVRTDADPRLQALHEQDPISFDHLSYLWNDPQALWEFGRCIQNNASEPLWIDWESFGWRTTVKGDNRQWQYYPADSDNDLEDGTELYYGPRPDLIEPTAVFGPDDLASLWQPPTIWRAQFQQGDLGIALGSVEDFRREIAVLQETTGLDGFRLAAYAEVALPRNGEVFGALREGAEVSNDDFFIVSISVGQRFTTNEEGVPVQASFLRVSSPIEELPLQVEAEPVVLEIEDEREVLQQILPAFEGEVRLEAFHEQPEAAFAFEAEPRTLSFPIELTAAPIAFRFGDYAEVQLQSLFALPPE